MTRGFLRNIKVGDQSIPEEIINAILDENSRDISAAKKELGDYESVKQQLLDANKVIESFKAMDIDGVKKAADEWKEKAEAAERNAAEKVAAMQFESLVEREIVKAKGRDVKAVRALLDTESLRASKNQEADVKAAVGQLVDEKGYLFDVGPTPPPYAAGTGTHAINGKYSPEENAIRAAAGLKTE